MTTRIRVFDFFSGCGGTSSGFRDAGMEIVFALDYDKDAAKTFKQNFPAAEVVCADITKQDSVLLKAIIEEGSGPTLFCGCAPCQPFSRQNGHKKHRDPRTNLLTHFGRFVQRWKPDYVVVENVPGLQKLPASGPFRRFLKLLDVQGYSFATDTLPASAFGVPQTRERLLLIASRHGKISLPKPSHGKGLNQKANSTVRDWIGDLPSLIAGEKDSKDSQHQCASLSPLNLKRIRATPEGGGRTSWPKKLWLTCHKGHVGHTDVYGRLAWDAPASGLTTRCISYSNGRFGHPEQNRALSVREAACLQTFDRRYEFIGSLGSRAKQIGNAVPPMMARALGKAVVEHARNQHMMLS